MEKMFCMGLALGMIGGALIVANSHKARTLVKKGQDEMVDKIETVIDNKLKNFCSKGEKEEYGGDMNAD